HQPHRPHAPAAVRAWQSGRDQHRPRRVRASGYELALRRREPAARVFRAIRHARVVGGPSLAARLRAHRSVGRLPRPRVMPMSERDALSALPSLPRDEGGPVFAEPWQAQAFALAVKLSELGHFTWKEWAAALAAELKAAADRGEPDDGSHYYEH